MSDEAQQEPRRPGDDFPGVTLSYAAIAVIACIFAFIGLGSGGFWIDELFSLFVIDHHGGLQEVFRRVLTDTHPPAYYFVLYAWSKAFGLSETALRSLSAVFAVAAVGIFAASVRKSFSPSATAFAAAVAATSNFVFFHAQNVRNYAPSLLTSALLLALAIRACSESREGRSPSAWTWAALSAAGLVASMVHFYGFLTTGLVYLFLLVSIPRRSLRIGLIASGAAIAAIEAVYLVLLHGHSLQDIHDTFFQNGAAYLFKHTRRALGLLVGAGGGTAAILLIAHALLRLWRAREAERAPFQFVWTGRLSLFVFVGTIVGGIAVSLILAPSYSDRNVLVAAPFGWALLASVYDAGGPRPGDRLGFAFAWLLVALVALQLLLLKGRFLPRTEQWRASAQSVASFPACGDEPIPVVFPDKFGPSTPFYYALAQGHYARYFPGPRERLRVFRLGEFEGTQANADLAALLRHRAAGDDPCPVLAWAVHDVTPDDAEAIARGVARQAGQPPGAVRIEAFTHYRPFAFGYLPAQAAFVFLNTVGANYRGGSRRGAELARTNRPPPD